MLTIWLKIERRPYSSTCTKLDASRYSRLLTPYDFSWRMFGRTDSLHRGITPFNFVGTVKKTCQIQSQRIVELGCLLILTVRLDTLSDPTSMALIQLRIIGRSQTYTYQLGANNDRLLLLCYFQSFTSTRSGLPKIWTQSTSTELEICSSGYQSNNFDFEVAIRIRFTMRTILKTY